MKKTTKILSVFMALVMVITCIPMTAFAKGRDTSSLDAFLSNENLAVLVEDLLTALDDRKEEFAPAVLNICFQVIDALKEQAAEDGIDVAEASTEELADSLLTYLDEVLADADLNSQLVIDIGGGQTIDIKSLAKYLNITKIDLNNVNGIFALLVEVGVVLKNPPTIASAIGIKDFGDAKNLDVSMFEHTPAKGKKPAVAISRENTDALDIIFKLFDFLSAEDNIDVISKVVAGTFTLGSANSAIKNLANLDIDAEIANLMGNLDVVINELLYNNLIGTAEDAPAYADSVYVDFSSDELLAAALLKLMSGKDATKAESAEVAKMSLSEIIGKYGDAVIASFAIEPLNNDLKKAINDLVGMDPQLEVLKNIINFDYEFKADTFNFASWSQSGLFSNLNNIVCTIAEVVLKPEVVAELGLKKDSNKDVNHNLTSVFGYILKTLAANNGGKLEFSIDGTAYSFDFSGFTADKIAGKSLEDMVVAVVGLFYPTLLQIELPAEVKTMEQLAGFTAYVCIDKFMVKEDSVDFDKDYSALVLADGKVRNISLAQWNNVLGEMGMDVAIYWLNDATNFGMTQAQVDALKAQGWTWEDFFEEIVDWALNYIDGVPAVADHLTTERGVQDGTAWYKLNTIFNELFPMGFIKDCGDETFTFDFYNGVMETIVPALYDCDFAAFADIIDEKTKSENNPLTKGLINAVLELVDNVLFSIFVHDCEKTATFTKEATATHDGYKGTYCVNNGHYLKVDVLPATGETTTEPPTTEPPTTEPPTTEPPTTEPPVSTRAKGDVDGNNKVNAMDARLALRAASKLDVLEGEAFTAADTTGDGRITAMDARAILRHSAKIELLK